MGQMLGFAGTKEEYISSAVALSPEASVPVSGEVQSHTLRTVKRCSVSEYLEPSKDLFGSDLFS